MRIFAGAAIVLALMNSNARADDLVVYGAGSLREAVTQIAAEFGRAHGLTGSGANGRIGPL
jgi:ABC-type molybdate transport system substrate-binding protein